MTDDEGAEGYDFSLDEVDPAWAVDCVVRAGARLNTRLERLEATTGEVGLMFLSLAEAKAIRRALAALRLIEADAGAAPPDAAMLRVLVEEFDAFIEGLSSAREGDV